MRKLLLLALGVWVVVLTGCNTMQGLGRDIETLGDRIEKKSSR